jgi:hypothetical protein
MLPTPMSSEMEVSKVRSFNKNTTILSNYIHNLCIFRIHAYRLIDGTLRSNGITEGEALLSKITEYHWIYESKHDKLYCLACIGANYIYFKIRISYQDRSSIKIVIADTYDDLIKCAMSKRAYKKYKKWMS